MTDIIERIAEAMRLKCEGPRGDFAWADNAGMPLYRELAVIAIKVMREPTTEMKDALNSWAQCEGCIDEGWAAAVDAALKS
jgi:hypothetical protein